MAALKYWVWLSALQGLSNQSKLALLHHFGSPEEVYFAGEEDHAQVEAITREQLTVLQDKSLLGVEEILHRCAEKDIFIITMDDALYPARLKNIYDPPILLYGRGKMPLFDDEVTIAMVGMRDASLYGLQCGEELGYDLARQGAVVVSGMAKGIDTACLRGALRAGGFACAVLGCGVDVIYPAENRRLYEDLVATGVVLSEYPPQTRPEGWHFPVRNRIMSGLSVGTVVVEAGETSGALITAASATEQGREVFCVPGAIHSPKSAGCHALIREGAILAAKAWDILSEYESRFPHKLRHLHDAVPPLPTLSGEQKAEPPAPVPPKVQRPKLNVRKAGLTDDQIALLRTLPADVPLLTDELAERCDLPMRRVLSALTMLEIDGHVEKSGAQSFVRTVDIDE